MLNRATITIFFFLLIAPESFSQSSSPVIFSRITRTEGLASNMVFHTARDQQGFLWIATQNGFQRYDGHRFLTFRHIAGDSSSISENSVNHLFIDSKQRFWLVFDKQAGIFNTASFRFAEKKLSAPVMIIKKIMEDDKGRIVLFADSKQFVYDEGKQSFTEGYPFPAFPPGYTASDMAINTADGSYWFTGKKGSLFYDPNTKQFRAGGPVMNVKKGWDSLAAVANARYPFIDKDGTYWMVNWIPFTAAAPVVYRYDQRKDLLQKFERIRAYKAESYYEVWSIFQQRNGAIWIYGMGLLAYYDAGAKRFVNITSDPFRQNGIDYDLVNQLYEDNEQNVWVSTNKGLYRFNSSAQVFHTLPNRRPGDTSVIHNSVSNIVHTANNGIWVSTWGAGIFSYNDQLQPVPNPYMQIDPAGKNLHVSSMMQRQNGEIWMGTHTGELKIYDPAANKFNAVVYQALKDQAIQQLFEDKQGNMWIGSNSGLLLKCEKGNWKDETSFSTVLSDAGDIFKLYQDSKDKLWVCTAATGVYEIDINSGKQVKQLKETEGGKNGLLNDGATDIVQYNDSVYLIASDGICLYNDHANSWEYLTAAEGLPAEHITAIIFDQKKRLWVACDGGLYRLNLENNLHVRYADMDGVTNDIFQVSSATLLRDGRIAIGTPGSFLVFNPERAIDQSEVPIPVITGFFSGEKRLSVDSLLALDKLVLRYNNTFTRIELSPLSFRNEYYMYYRLKGLDEAWNRVYNNEISYQYLPPGDYTLELKSENGDGKESRIVSSLHIRVNAPFWKTWWFYSLLAMLIIGLLFWFDHARMKRKERVLKMRSDIADDLHKDISNALSNITILSKMAKMKADNEPEKSKEFIDEIHTKSHNMTLAMEDMLWSIDPEHDNMENLVLRFREYVDALKSQHQVQIDVLVDKKATHVPLKMRMRNDVLWLFKGGINTTVRAGAANCRIHITYEKLQLVYTLEFDTENIDQQLLNNRRMRNELAEKLEAVNAKLDFTMHKTSALFILSIPVKGDGW